ncbi:hypothetical protein WJX77_009167 [Trebouxia sp. C0004]
MAASKLGMMDKLLSAVEKLPSLAQSRDGEGRTCLHYVAGYGHEECVERLLEKKFDPEVQDHNGDTALHLAAIHGCPMSAFNLTKAAPATCLTRNLKEQRPADVAKACERGEVLNAMLLACSGDATAVAVEAMQYLLQEGAVPDTWAPNGSSALMLAASVDGVAAIQLLLKHGATIELQDALGRSALMFAAGNCAEAALLALLAAGATLGLRDRRSRSVLDYAPEGSKVKQQLLDRLKELEAAAEQLQAALLAELDGPLQSGSTGSKKKSKAKKSKKKQVSAAAMNQAVLATDPQPAANLPTHASAPQTPPATSQAPSATSQAPSAMSQAPSATSQGRSTQLPANTRAPPLIQSHQPRAPVDGHHADSIEADVPAAIKLELPSEKPETAATRASNEAASSDVTSSMAAQATAVHEITYDESCLGSSHPAADAAQPSSSSSSSARSDSDSPPSTPVSDRSAAQASAQSSQTSLGCASQPDQQVAVLSLLAEVAADPASPLTHPQSMRSAHAESSAHEHRSSPQADVAAVLSASTERQSLQPADVPSAGTSSGLASESSLDIYDALREDRGNRNDWRVVKAGRKSGSNTTKAVDKHTDLPSAPDQQQQQGMSHRGMSAESSLRSQEGGAEAAAHAVSDELGHSGKTVRRCSSGAFISSWSSAEGVEPVDRSSGRPGNVTLGQYMKPANAASHGSRPPPPPAFRSPPPPPPGPPPSSSSHSALSSTSKGQLGSVPAQEPRQNAWDQPLPGSRLSQLTGAHANALLPGSHVQAQPDASRSGSSDSAQVRGCERQNGYCEVAMVGTISHSPVLENGDGPVAELPEAQQQTDGYASEPQHLAQIADLQGEVTALRGDVAHLFLALKAAKSRHQQELAGVIIDAAQHQTKAIAEAIAKERAATAAMLQAAAAAQQPALQSRPTHSLDSRGPSHLSRPRHQQQQQQVVADQEIPFARSRLGNPRPQQALLGSQDGLNAAAPAGLAAPLFATRQTNGHAHETTPLPLGPLSGAAGGLTGSHSSDDLREGFRRAVSAVPEDSRLPHIRRDDLLSCSINHVLPHVASWGNLSNQSSSSNSGLHENTSRGLPTFQPISTPAGLFNSSGTASSDKGSFPSYLASIWSGDAKSGSLSGSPNSHFEQPSLLNNHH